MASVASLLALDRTTLTAALKPLERRGFVIIETDVSDRRARRLTLTQKGRECLASAVSTWEETHKLVEECLPDGEPDHLRRNLMALSG